MCTVVKLMTIFEQKGTKMNCMTIFFQKDERSKIVFQKDE